MDKEALQKFSYGLYVVGVKGKDYFGGCIVDAVAQLSMQENPTIVLASMLQNETNRLIKEKSEFTLSVLPESVDPFVIGNFGFQSARDVDKWENVPYEVKDDLPVLKEALSFVRLNVQEKIELETHTAFICKTKDAEVLHDGKPLIYADYFTKLKDKVMTAFMEFKKK
jgi:flavin reductase (DIM6/NTAB) family NADH-FMN oxidoreductase RutF